MSLSVREVVALPVLQAGDPQVLSDRRWHEAIRWVHVGEVADLSALLQGGELVLTTGAALRSDPQRYLRGLADAGALGVVVEIGTGHADVPAPVVELARRLDLALVALHREIRFVDVTEVVHRRIVAAQFDEVAFDRRVHETFTELSVNRASAAAIVDAAADILDEPVVLEDLAHQALIVSTHGGRAANVLEDWERRSRRMSAGGGAENWAVTAVGPRGEEWGRLIVPRRPTDPARSTMVLERAAAALSLHRMMERNRTGLHQQAQSGLIDDVLGGRITDEREIAARAHALGLDGQAKYHPVVVRVARSSAPADPVAAQRRNVNLLGAVAHPVNSAGHSGLFAIRGDDEIGLLVALRSGRGGAERSLEALGERLHADLLRLDGVARCVCACGDPAAQVVDAIRSLPRVQHIAEVAIAMAGTERRVFRAADVRLRGLIALLRDDPRVQQFAEAEVGALLVDEGDGARSDLEILRRFIESGGNKALLAQRLHVSRPALYKRLASIGRRLGVALDDAESLTSLHVALLILDSRTGG